jgi:hypothetical protein
MRAQGLTVETIASALGVEVVTVLRVLVDMMAER